MTTDAIYKERSSDWSHQVSAMERTRRLQRNQTLPLTAKDVACDTTSFYHFFSTQEAVRMRVRLSYTVNGTAVQEQAEINNFPPQLAQ